MPYADKERAKVYWREYKRAWKARNKDRVKARETKRYRENRGQHMANCRARYLLRTYGVTEEWYAETLAKQDGKCAICKKSQQSGRKLSVDHCHVTGRVRGLLCVSCNSRVEKFEAYLRACREAEAPDA